MLMLNRKRAAESLGAGIAGLGGPRRQVPIGDLLFGDRYALKDDVGIWSKLAQRFLDLLTGIDARGIEVPQVIDVGRNVESVDVLGRAEEERERGIAARHHQRHVIH